MPERTLGVLLARGPATPDADLALGLGRAARMAGTVLRVFLMGEGVECVTSDGFRELARGGVHVAVCSRTAAANRLPLDTPGIDYASQYRLAAFVAECDRFVSFT
jgi:sulfur relay (sulfurtransferase) complex TusBCD TusD component (DsrE family)